MRRTLLVLLLSAVATAPAAGHGILLPVKKSMPPLAMLNHSVRITLEDQVAVTRVEQTFRNPTDRPLEATYIFPVPRGASVNKFTMWVDGKETAGELVEADKARNIYTSIVQRTRDPGLLEYLDNNLLQMRVFPVPARGDQKIALSYTSVAPKDGDVVEYIYPLKADSRYASTLEEFSIQAVVKSQHGVANVYSPTHAVTLKRVSDQEMSVTFDRSQGLLDKDFQLFYASGAKDVGLTALAHRPLSGEPGYVTMLISPKLEMNSKTMPRDMVLVLDTSGSMRGLKMDQARNALKYCLENLGGQDRFALINFATTVNKYREKLTDVSPEQVADAKKWVANLEATGGTAINDALAAALELRPKDEGRPFTIVFFTDGQPTIGETKPERILKNVTALNSGNTRIFTFGVGDDVNATMLDQLADMTRAVSTYVRPAEDIQAKVAGLYAKVSNPVLSNLKIVASNGVQFSEVYPTQLPDLFQGGQIVVLGRYTGKGPAAITLSGQIGKATKEFVYEFTFPEKTGDERNFVEQLWARRKVGFMLDQIRANGEKKELVDEVVVLAKKYGITTPYTSYLIVPDGVAPTAGPGGPRPVFGGFQGGGGGMVPPALRTAGGKGQASTEEFARAGNNKPGSLAGKRDAFEDDRLGKDAIAGGRALADAKEKKAAYDDARRALNRGDREGVQAGKLGVDLSIQTQNLRNQSRLEETAAKNVLGRNVLEVGGVWIDEGFVADTKAVTVKAQSEAYFAILKRHAKVKDVFQLGNHVVWVTPSGVALVVDTTTGQETMSDAEIDKLFVAKK